MAKRGKVKELGMVIMACFIFVVFFATMIYPDIEVKGYRNIRSCTGECYKQYVAKNGTVVEQLRAKRELANLDEFSPIRGLWSGCAACHGAEGQGMAVFPKLAGQSADYIASRLNIYRNRGEVGSMSSTMWAQAGKLSDAEIDMLGKFIEVELN